MGNGNAEKPIASRTDRAVRRQRELSELTVEQVAARGDKVRMMCLDCGKSFNTSSNVVG